MGQFVSSLRDFQPTGTTFAIPPRVRDSTQPTIKLAIWPPNLADSTVVVLEPDVAAAFPSAGQANDALRALAGIIQKHRPRRAGPGSNDTHR
ncbi:MAG: hypothetical protein ACLQVG_32925 [Terriglobia bacterium]